MANVNRAASPVQWVQLHPRSVFRDDFGKDHECRVANLPLGRKSMALSDAEAHLLASLYAPRRLADAVRSFARESGLAEAEALRHLQRRLIEPQFVALSSSKPSVRKQAHSQFRLPAGIGCRPSRTPYSIYLELTQACNLRCVHCFATEGGRSAMLPFPTIAGLFAEMEAMGVLHLTLSGGEPTLHPRFAEVLELAAGSSMAFSILTNATRFERNPELLEQIIDCAKNRNQAMTLGISLDGISASSHERIRVTPGSYRLARRAIEKLAAAGVTGITLHMMLCSHNFAELEALVEWAAELGIDQVVPFDLLAHGSGKPATRLGLSFHQQLRVFETVKRLQKRFEGRISVMPPKHCRNAMTTLLAEAVSRTPERPYCSAGVKELAIRADGKIHPCPFVWDEEFTLGNVHSGSLLDAWHSPQLAFFRGGYRVSELGKCADCEHGQHCVGIECRAAAIGRGDKYGPGSSCAVELQSRKGSCAEAASARKFAVAASQTNKTEVSYR